MHHDHHCHFLHTFTPSLKIWLSQLIKFSYLFKWSSHPKLHPFCYRWPTQKPLLASPPEAGPLITWSSWALPWAYKGGEVEGWVGTGDCWKECSPTVFGAGDARKESGDTRSLEVDYCSPQLWAYVGSHDELAEWSLARRECLEGLVGWAWAAAGSCRMYNDNLHEEVHLLHNHLHTILSPNDD
jgi:hypothetical protein